MGEPTAATKRLGLSRSTKVVSGAVAVAVIAGGAWAAGTALHSSHATVRFQPAASTGATGTSGTTPGSTATPKPHRRFGLGFGPGGGTVAGVNPASTSFTLNVPTRPLPSTTPGAAPVTPATPTTHTATVDVTGSTTYLVTKNGALSDIAAHMRVVAIGTTNTDGSLAATQLELVQAGVGPTPPTAPKTGTATPPVTPNPGTSANHPMAAFGTITTVTQNSPAAGDVSFVVTTPRGTRTVDATSTTIVTITTKGTFADVTPGAQVFVRGQRATTTTGTVTATAVDIVAAGVKGPGRFGFGFGFGPGGFGPGGPGGGGPGGPMGRWHGGTPPSGTSPASPTAAGSASNPI